MSVRRARVHARVSGLGLVLLLAGSSAWAEEPLQPTEPSVFRDTAVELLDVADAFDDRDVFDLDLRLSFDHDQRSAPVRRETSINQPGLSEHGYTSDRLDVATYQESTQRLIPQIDIGILPEFALKVRMPVILAHNRRLEEASGGTSSFATAGVLGEQLFSVPFTSPTRSGIEYLAVGLDLGLMNQYRSPHQPNWVVGIEGRFNVSEAMHACNANPAEGQVECAHPSDINRNGRVDPLGSSYGSLAARPEGDFAAGGRAPGVSRGTTAFEAHAYVSKRYKYIEPYSGVSALFEFPLTSSDYGEMDLESSLVNHPPLRGTVTAGLAVIPWERPEKHQRIALDFRLRGTYVSEGRDYSELFDALGSSSANSLRSANFARYMPNVNSDGEVNQAQPSIVDPNSNRVHFTGLTDVQQHGDYDLRAQFTWQAGEYVKFDLGGTFRIVEAHFITFDQACNPNFSGDPSVGGPCSFPVGSTTRADGREGTLWQAAGIPNANYRRVVNEPGRRYKVDTSFGFGGFIRASVLF